MYEMLVQVHILYPQFWNPKSSNRNIYIYTHAHRVTTLAARPNLIQNLESEPDWHIYEAMDSLYLSHLCECW